jgi:hypothetical protein
MKWKVRDFYGSFFFAYLLHSCFQLKSYSQIIVHFMDTMSQDELGVRKPLIVSISHGSEELGLQSGLKFEDFKTRLK